MRTITKYLLPLGFVFGIFLFFYFSTILGYNNQLEAEKREATPLPSIDLLLDSPIDYVEQFSSYIDDRILFKTGLTGIKNTLKFHLFYESPYPKQVILGKEGWWFYNKENNMETYHGIPAYHVNQLAQLHSSLRQKQTWLHAQGIDFVLFIAPSKPEIYREYLPLEHQKEGAQKSSADQVYNFLKQDSSLHIVYPKQVLIEAKGEGLVYYPEDSHWNIQGAYLGYLELQKYINANFGHGTKAIPYSDFNPVDSVKSDFDLLQVANIHLNASRVILYPQAPNGLRLNDESEEQKEGNKRRYEVRYVSNASTQDKVLLYRDSFFEDVSLFLSFNYKQSVYLWTHDMKAADILNEKPQVVVLEVTQRSLEDLWIPNDPAFLSSSQRSL